VAIAAGQLSPIPEINWKLEYTSISFSVDSYAHYQNVSLILPAAYGKML
jgi:hypothetical protein